MSVTIVAISDTHGMHRDLEIPDGDVLVHAGDLTSHGQLEQVAAFDDFLGALPHPHKVLIAGNHDFCFEREPEASRALITNATYLQDEEATVGSLRFYGSPWQPWFFDFAFNLQRGPELAAKWDLIPQGIDVLITHGPPLGHGDRVASGKQEGCADLLQAVRRIRPGLHLFGHIHEAYGISGEGPTTFINASTCTLRYRPENPPMVFHYQGRV